MEKLERECTFLIHLVTQICQMTNFFPTGTQQNEGVANNTVRMNVTGECPDKIWVVLLLAWSNTSSCWSSLLKKEMLEDFCVYFSIVVISIYQSMSCCAAKKYCDRLSDYEPIAWTESASCINL